MPFNNRNRDLLSLVHHSERDLHYLLDLARDLKRAKYAGVEQQHLRGKNIALIFEKTSTRTRCAFEVAAYDEGAHVTYIDPSSSQIGHKESMKDTARVLGRMYDAIEYRGSGQENVEDLARHAGVRQRRGDETRHARKCRPPPRRPFAAHRPPNRRARRRTRRAARAAPRASHRGCASVRPSGRSRPSRSSRSVVAAVRRRSFLRAGGARLARSRCRRR